MLLDYTEMKKGGGGQRMHAGHHLLWPLHSAYASSTGTSFGGQGAFPLSLYEKMYYALSDTAVDVKM